MAELEKKSAKLDGLACVLQVPNGTIEVCKMHKDVAWLHMSVKLKGACVRGHLHLGIGDGFRRPAAEEMGF